MSDSLVRELIGLPPESQQRIAQLLQALSLAGDNAARASLSAWELALSRRDAECTGATIIELYWLRIHHLIAAGQERTRSNSPRRIFKPLQNLAFPDRVCFILANPLSLQLQVWLGCTLASDFSPRWDSGSKRLTLGGLLVKELSKPALSQALLLDSFQEQKWPPRIDDPLPGEDGQDRHDRLHAVRGLNRCQVHRLLRFTRDGRGNGVCWERVAVEASNGDGPDLTGQTADRE